MYIIVQNYNTVHNTVQNTITLYMKYCTHMLLPIVIFLACALVLKFGFISTMYFFCNDLMTISSFSLFFFFHNKWVYGSLYSVFNFFPYSFNSIFCSAVLYSKSITMMLSIFSIIFITLFSSSINCKIDWGCDLYILTT